MKSFPLCRMAIPRISEGGGNMSTCLLHRLLSAPSAVTAHYYRLPVSVSSQCAAPFSSVPSPGSSSGQSPTTPSASSPNSSPTNLPGGGARSPELCLSAKDRGKICHSRSCLPSIDLSSACSTDSGTSGSSCSLGSSASPTQNRRSSSTSSPSLVLEQSLSHSLNYLSKYTLGIPQPPPFIFSAFAPLFYFSKTLNCITALGFATYLARHHFASFRHDFPSGVKLALSYFLESLESYDSNAIRNCCDAAIHTPLQMALENLQSHNCRVVAELHSVQKMKITDMTLLIGAQRGEHLRGRKVDKWLGHQFILGDEEESSLDGKPADYDSDSERGPLSSLEDNSRQPRQRPDSHRTDKAAISSSPSSSIPSSAPPCESSASADATSGSVVQSTLSKQEKAPQSSADCSAAGSTTEDSNDHSDTQAKQSGGSSGSSTRFSRTSSPGKPTARRLSTSHLGNSVSLREIVDRGCILSFEILVEARQTFYVERMGPVSSSVESSISAVSSCSPNPVSDTLPVVDVKASETIASAESCSPADVASSVYPKLLLGKRPDGLETMAQTSPTSRESTSVEGSSSSSGAPSKTSGRFVPSEDYLKTLSPVFYLLKFETLISPRNPHLTFCPTNEPHRREEEDPRIESDPEFDASEWTLVDVNHVVADGNYPLRL